MMLYSVYIGNTSNKYLSRYQHLQQMYRNQNLQYNVAGLDSDAEGRATIRMGMLSMLT